MNPFWDPFECIGLDGCTGWCLIDKVEVSISGISYGIDGASAWILHISYTKIHRSLYDYTLKQSYLSNVTTKLLLLFSPDQILPFGNRFFCCACCVLRYSE